MLYILKTSPEVSFINNRALPAESTLGTQAAALVTAALTEPHACERYEIETTIAYRLPAADPEAPSNQAIEPVQTPAIVLRAPPYAFTLDGPEVEALLAAIDAQLAAFTAADAARAADLLANPPVPEFVRAAALRLVLNARGLRSAVESAVAASPQDARDLWEYEPAIRRDHALVAGLAAALNLTAAQVDQIFRDAAVL